MAFHGYLNANLIFLISAFASYIGHGTFFLIALYKRNEFLNFVQKFIKVDLTRLENLMRRYGTASVFISQWLYGFRLLSAAVLGLSGIGKKKYFFLLFISCLLWAIICTYAGYFFGATLKNLLGDIKKYDKYIALGVVIFGFILWLKKDIKKRRNSKDQV